MFRLSSRLAASAVAAAFLTAGCHDDTPPAPAVVTTPVPSTTIAPAGSPPTAVTLSTGPDTKINTNAGPGGSTGTDAALA